MKNEKPVQVLTGSTNFTDGGIYGQSNVVHIVRDPETASKYLEYWTKLSEDTPVKYLNEWTIENTPTPTGTLSNGIQPIFSPRKTLDALVWYSKEINNASDIAAFTAAFDVNKLFADVMAKNKKNVRYVLLEKPGPTYSQFSKLKNNFISIGAVLSQEVIGDTELHRWVGEKLTGLNSFVKYLHTKYLLIDPLSDNPVVISGSANFSDASTVKNDENMLIIKGNTMVADIYLGEFMRLWNHFYFRVIANRYAQLKTKKEAGTKIRKSKNTSETLTCPRFRYQV